MDFLLEPILNAWAPSQESGLNDSPFDWGALASTARFQCLTVKNHPGWQSIRCAFRERCQDCTDLATAVRRGDLDLLRHCAEVRGEHVRSSSAPLLHIAIQHMPANVTVVKYLLEKGFDPDSCGGQKFTPLQEALLWVFQYSKQHPWEDLPETEVVRLLLKAGADVQIPYARSYSSLVQKGDTPLTWLLEHHGRLTWRLSRLDQIPCLAGLIQLLVDHGACEGPNFRIDHRRALRLQEILGPRFPSDLQKFLGISGRETNESPPQPRPSPPQLISVHSKRQKGAPERNARKPPNEERKGRSVKRLHIQKHAGKPKKAIRRRLPR